jgi:lipid II:glycine glycyltransferase (peptidoglycan interpeptide bridge formation enzyme)
MGIDIDVTENIDVNEWDELLANSEDATVFHTYEWIKVLNETYSRYSKLFITARNGDGKLIGGMPLIISKNRIIRGLTSMPFGTYGGSVVRSGIVHEPVVRRKILGKFQEIEKKWKLNRSVLVDFQNTHGHLESLGFERRNAFTHILELNQPLEQIRRRIKKEKRRAIRQAVQRGVIIKEVHNALEFEPLYAIFEHTYSRHGSVPYPLKLYEKILTIMGKKGTVQCRVAKHDNTSLACSIYFTHKDSIMYWIGVSYEKYWGFRPNDLLIWSVIEYGVANGYKILNLGASPLEAKELIRFKHSWGAQSIEYSIYEKSSRLLRIALSLRNLFR